MAPGTLTPGDTWAPREASWGRGWSRVTGSKQSFRSLALGRRGVPGALTRPQHALARTARSPF